MREEGGVEKQLATLRCVGGSVCGPFLAAFKYRCNKGRFMHASMHTCKEVMFTRKKMINSKTWHQSRE